jgi:NAD(P)-dependent dehydrogenase (short-subunit alcohol dehydrogenase family)
VTPPERSYVVTGGGRGIGRAIAARLVHEIAAVVVVDVSEPAPQDGVTAVVGDAADEGVALRAAELAELQAPLAGWVNNAAVFDDVDLAADPTGVLRVVAANLAPAVVGSAVAVRHLAERGRAGSIVNVSSHQAQRAVRGALAYATAKAALEGLTRALAVDEGPRGIRVNAVALGSITTERYERHLYSLDPAGREEVESEMAALHPLGRVGRPEEVADVVAWLLGPESGYVTGAVLPVDGGRAAQGRDPEER